MLVWSRRRESPGAGTRERSVNDNDNDNDNAAWPGQAPAGSRDQLRDIERRDQLQRIEVRDQLREHVPERCALVALVELERWRVASL